MEGSLKQIWKKRDAAAEQSTGPSAGLSEIR